MNFKIRNRLAIFRPYEEASFIDADCVKYHALQFFKRLSFYPLQYISNTDQVTVLFRSLRRLSINPNDIITSPRLLKARLRAILTVFGDG